MQQKQQSKAQSQHSKVVPFTGELYTHPTPEPPPASDNLAAFLALGAAVLVAGLSIGAMTTYQSTDQVELRQLKAEREQLQKVRSNVCN